MTAIIKYRYGKRGQWRTVINERRQPKRYANKQEARRSAMRFRRRKPGIPFYFRIEEV
jgi:hypothetical protein